MFTAGNVTSTKVDKCVKGLAGNHGEKVTESMDGLGTHQSEYALLNYRFAKWRTAASAHDSLPTRGWITANT